MQSDVLRTKDGDSKKVLVALVASAVLTDFLHGLISLEAKHLHTILMF
jgi:hypothetical protein